MVIVLMLKKNASPFLNMTFCITSTIWMVLGMAVLLQSHFSGKPKTATEKQGCNTNNNEKSICDKGNDTAFVIGRNKEHVSTETSNKQ
jgi:hypothetical protein